MENNIQSYEGVLLIDKPQTYTSHDVVNRVRRKLSMKRIGHAGTLDPMATGLLIILVGKATKASQYLMSSSKVYEGTFRLGVETSSQDADGEITSTMDCPDINESDLQKYMDTFLGDQYQVPPMFSAKKIGGVALYKLARKGKEVKREPKFINVSEFSLKGWNKPDGKFLAKCSKGTYIRTLSYDLGKKIGCGAHLIQLRRIASGDFSIDKAVTLDDFMDFSPEQINDCLIPLFDAMPSYML